MTSLSCIHCKFCEGLRRFASRCSHFTLRVLRMSLILSHTQKMQRIVEACICGKALVTSQGLRVTRRCDSYAMLAVAEVGCYNMAILSCPLYEATFPVTLIGERIGHYQCMRVLATPGQIDRFREIGGWGSYSSLSFESWVWLEPNISA